MFRFLKRLISVAIVLAAIALVLNLKIAGRPARDHATEIWQSESVQKVYHVVRDRFLALIRKDISVEEVFQGGLPKKNSEPVAAPSNAGSTQLSGAPKEETKVIELEKLDEADRKALQDILQKSAK